MKTVLSFCSFSRFSIKEFADMSTADIVRQEMESAKQRVRNILVLSSASPRDVVARYTATFAVNFTDWIGKTLPWVRHEAARLALTDNLRCESMEDHVGMLLDGAKDLCALPCRTDYDHVGRGVNSIRGVFKDPKTSGLKGLAILAALEETSPVFIPNLAGCAKALSQDSSKALLHYCNIHGEADKDHADALISALCLEFSMGYHEHPETLIKLTSLGSTHLIQQIWS